MEMQKFFNVLTFEFKATFRMTLKKLLFLFGIINVFSIIFFEKANNLSYSASVGDCLLYIMKGNEVYIPKLEKPFEIPIMWYLIYLLVFYIIMDYTNTTFYILGKQSFIKIKSRYYWWYAKCIMCLCVTILSYITIICSIFCVAIFRGNVSFMISLEIAEVISNISFVEYSTISIWNSILFIPILTVFTIGIIQILISLLGKTLYSYFLICIYLVASTYYHKYYIFIGNFMIPIRNRLMYTRGYDSILALTIDIGLLLGAFYGGKIIIRKYDVM